MPRFNSLQEFDEWRRGQGLSSVRETTRREPLGRTTPEPDVSLAPPPQPNGDTTPTPPVQTQSSAMSMGQAPPMPRRSFKMRFRRLIPALAWITAAIAVFVIWNLFSPFTAEVIIWNILAPFTATVVTWISSSVSLWSFGAAILAIVIAGYVVVLHHQVQEVLPQDILTLRADVMRRLAKIESSEHTSGKSSGQTSGTSTASQEQTTTIQKEFEQWMQSEQPTPSP